MPLAFNVSTHVHCIRCKRVAVLHARMVRARTRLWCKIMSGLALCGTIGAYNSAMSAFYKVTSNLSIIIVDQLEG